MPPSSRRRNSPSSLNYKRHRPPTPISPSSYTSSSPPPSSSRRYNNSTRRDSRRSPPRDRHSHRHRSKRHKESSRRGRYSSRYHSSEDSENDRSVSDISEEYKLDYYNRRSTSPPYAATIYIIIRNLPSSCIAEQLEEQLRGISIQRGFSLPNNVVVQKVEGRDESVGEVEFPSTDAAYRFFKVFGRRNAFMVGDRRCSVEFGESDGLRERSVSGLKWRVEGGMLYNDWTCIHCRYRNFARRTVCGSCGGGYTGELTHQQLEVPTGGSGSAVRPACEWLMLRGVSPVLTVEMVRTSVDGVCEERGLEVRRYDVSVFQPSEASVVQASGGRGFCIVKCNSVLEAANLLGAIRSTGGFLNNRYSRVDVMTMKEKEAFNEMVRMVNDGREMDLSDVERLSTMGGVSPYWKEYVLQWTGRCIHILNGPPDITNFTFDSNSGYLYDVQLRLYYDPSTQYYMNSNGDYYVWEEGSSSLRRIFSFDQPVVGGMRGRVGEKGGVLQESSDRGGGVEEGLVVPGEDADNGGNNETHNTNKKEAASTVVANFLAAAEQTAKASKDTVKVLGSVVSSEKKLNGGGLNTLGGVGGGVEKSKTLQCDVECDGYSDVHQNYTSIARRNDVSSIFQSNFNEDVGDVDTHDNIHQNTRGPLDGAIYDTAKMGGEGVENSMVDSTAVHSNAHKNKHFLTAEAKFICFACIRKFKSADLLEKHEKHSNLHKANTHHFVTATN